MNDLIILAALLPRPTHGYALKKQVGLLTGQRDLHNNLVYPLLHRFVVNAWVRKRKSAGQRGQTREIYSLTAKGKQELLRRLREYPAAETSSDNGFRLRVGLFDFLDAQTHQRILAGRDQFLASRQQRLAQISALVETGSWGHEVVRFFGDQVRAERAWIAGLGRKAKRETKAARNSQVNSRSRR
jgi:DNA-binding PadR family transcriptional regulator